MFIVKYGPLSLGFPSTGIKFMTGNLAIGVNGDGSHRHIFFSSQPAPSKYKLCTYTPFYKKKNKHGNIFNVNSKKKKKSNK